MRIDVIYTLRFPDGRCWSTTPIYEQAVEAAKSKAKQDGIPIEVVQFNLTTGQVRRNIYHPDGRIEKCWKIGCKDW